MNLFIMIKLISKGVYPPRNAGRIRTHWAQLNSRDKIILLHVAIYSGLLNIRVPFVPLDLIELPMNSVKNSVNNELVYFAVVKSRFIKFLDIREIRS